MTISTYFAYKHNRHCHTVSAVWVGSCCSQISHDPLNRYLHNHMGCLERVNEPGITVRKVGIGMRGLVGGGVAGLLPSGHFAADGIKGQYIIVIPSQELVITHNGWATKNIPIGQGGSYFGNISASFPGAIIK